MVQDSCGKQGTLQWIQASSSSSNSGSHSNTRTDKRTGKTNLITFKMREVCSKSDGLSKYSVMHFSSSLISWLCTCIHWNFTNTTKCWMHDYTQRAHRVYINSLFLLSLLTESDCLDSGMLTALLIFRLILETVVSSGLMWNFIDRCDWWVFHSTSSETRESPTGKNNKLNTHHTYTYTHTHYTPH